MFFLFLHIWTFYRLQPDTGKLGMSYSKFKKKDLGQLGQLIVKVKYFTLSSVYDHSAIAQFVDVWMMCINI